MKRSCRRMYGEFLSVLDYLCPVSARCEDTVAFNFQCPSDIDLLTLGMLKDSATP